MAGVTSPVVTASGQVQGHSDPRTGLLEFRGIAYAAGLTTTSRFEAPRQHLGWTGVRDCTLWAPVAPQFPDPDGSPPEGFSGLERPGGSECLALNIITPAAEPSARLPVMVYIHGGGYYEGASSVSVIHGAALAARGVVFVSLNYRLGWEGFGHIAGQRANRGLMDMEQGLKWVQENISAFGGDPGNVTLFGQSAGAGSVSALVSIFRTGTLFQRAIAQSVPGMIIGASEAEQTALALCKILKTAPTPESLGHIGAERRRAAQKELMAQAQARPHDYSFITGPLLFAPTLDGIMLKNPPWESAHPTKISLITGYCREEWALFMGRTSGPPLDFNSPFMQTMTDRAFRLPSLAMAACHQKNGGETRLYEVRWDAAPLRACHCCELPLIFGTPDTEDGVRFIGTPPPADFAGRAEAMRSAWINFAKTGDPGDGWTPYDSQTRAMRIWDTVPSIEAGTGNTRP